MELETEIVSRPDATTNSGPSLQKKKKNGYISASALNNILCYIQCSEEYES